MKQRKPRHKIKKDDILKDYWHDNARFADLFNQVFFAVTRLFIPSSWKKVTRMRQWSFKKQASLPPGEETS